MSLSFFALVFFSPFLIGFAFADTDNTQLFSDQALELLKQGSFQESITYFDRVLEIDPNHVLALNNKGIALVKMEKPEESITYFDRVLEIDPNYVEALNNKGVALVQMEKPEESITYFDRVLEIDPNHVLALYTKGVALVQMEKPEESITYFQKGVEIELDNQVIEKKIKYFGGNSYIATDGLLEITVRDSNEKLVSHTISTEILILDSELSYLIFEKIGHKETVFKNGAELDIFKYKEEKSPQLNSSYANGGLIYGNPPIIVIMYNHNQLLISKGDTIFTTITVFRPVVDGSSDIINSQHPKNWEFFDLFRGK